MKYIDKTVISKYEPKTTDVMWVFPTENGETELRTFVNGKWKTVTDESDAYRKPQDGIPESDLSPAVKNTLDSADISAQIVNNKDHKPTQFSGLGRVNLEKNIQTIESVEKNILTQDMFYKTVGSQRVPNTNTIFVIQYDYDLNGEEITIPEGCVLKFDGGSIKNGIIEGNNYIIEDTDKNIFENVKLSCPNSVVKLCWFRNVTTEEINYCIANGASKIVFEANKTYNLDIVSNKGIVCGNSIVLEGESTTLSFPNPNNILYTVLIYIDANNVSLNGLKIVGDRLNSGIEEYQYSHGVYITDHCSGVTIEKCELKEFRGDCIYIGNDSGNDYSANNIAIKNNLFYNTGRNQISIIKGSDIIIDGNKFYRSGSVLSIDNSSRLAIDAEANNSNQTISNVIVSNNEINGQSSPSCFSGGIAFHPFAPISDLKIINNKILNVKEFAIYVYNDTNIGQTAYITNNVIYNIDGYACKIKNVIFDNNVIIDSKYIKHNSSNETSIQVISNCTIKSSLKDLNYTVFENCDISDGTIQEDGAYYITNCEFSNCQIHDIGLTGSIICNGDYIKFNNCNIEKFSVSILASGNISDVFNMATSSKLLEFNNCHVNLSPSEYTISLAYKGIIKFINSIFYSTTIGSYGYVDAIEVEDSTIELVHAGNVVFNKTGDLATLKLTNSTLKTDYFSVYKITNISASLVKINNLNYIGNNTSFPQKSGTERPDFSILANCYVGFQFFDTTIGKPIYWNGTAWVDATGAVVS